MGNNSSLPCLSCPLFLFFLSLFCPGCSVTLQVRRCLILLHASAELPVQGRGTGRTENCQHCRQGGFQEKQGPPVLLGRSLMPCSLMLTEPCSAAAFSWS